MIHKVSQFNVLQKSLATCNQISCSLVISFICLLAPRIAPGQEKHLENDSLHHAFVHQLAQMDTALHTVEDQLLLLEQAGWQLFLRQDYIRSYHWLLKGISLMESGRYEGPLHARFYYKAGVLAFHLEKFDSARKYYQLGIRKCTDNALLMSLNNELGGVYVVTNQYDEAITCFKNSIGLSGQSADELRGRFIAQGNLGMALMNSGHPEEALPHIREAYAYSQKHLGPNTWQAIMFQQNLANNYSLMGQTAKGDSLLFAALKRSKKHNGIGHPYTCHIRHSVALDLLKKGQYDAAIDTLDQAIRDLAETNTRNIEDILMNSRTHQDLIFNLAISRSKALIQQQQQTQQKDALLQAKATMESLVQNLERNFENSYSAYEETIYRKYIPQIYGQLLYLHNRLEEDNPEDAIHLMIASGIAQKRLVLNGEHTKNKLLKRDELNNLIQQYHRALNNHDTASAEMWQQEYLRRKQRMANQPPSALSTQKLAEDPDYSLPDRYIYYFDADSLIYRAANIGGKPQLTVLQTHEDFEKSIKILRADNDRTPEEYHDAALQLYQFLMDGLNISSAKSVHIFPHGRIWDINFEALVTKKSADPSDYSQFQYLIKNCLVTYRYYHDLQSNAQEGSSPEVLTVEFQGSDQSSIGFFRDALGKLPMATGEIREIQKLFGQSTVSARSKWDILRDTEHNILHFATHGMTDKKNPLMSRLYLSDHSGDSAAVFAYDLLTSDINKRMVVLNACDSGDGQLDQSEGLQSLAYYFRLSNCPTIVASRYRLADQSSYELMKAFYHHIKEGDHSGEALRRAKLSYLDQSDPLTANPLFWSGLYHIGIYQTFASPSAKNQTIVFLLTGIFLLVILVTIVSKIRRRSDTSDLER